jgi:hypothetical protein
VPQSQKDAIVWLRQAAEKGRVEAQFVLGIIYGGNGGQPLDYAEFAKWMLKAAEQGHSKAQEIIGHAYANGQGVTKDVVEAHKWLTLAASSITGFARKKLDANKAAIAAGMTPEQIKDAEARASAWTPRKP